MGVRFQRYTIPRAAATLRLGSPSMNARTLILASDEASLSHIASIANIVLPTLVYVSLAYHVTVTRTD